MRIHADPDPGQTLKSHKMKRRNKSFLKSRKSGLFVNFEIRFICYFWSMSMLLVPDPNTGQQN
jgi:hypothetical protein